MILRFGPKLAARCIVSSLSLLQNQSYPQKRMTMYTADKPDYVKKWKEDEPKEVDRRKLYPVYTPPVIKKRDLIADKVYTLDWFQDERNKVGHDFFFSLPLEVQDKLIKIHIAPSDHL